MYKLSRRLLDSKNVRRTLSLNVDRWRDLTVILIMPRKIIALELNDEIVCVVFYRINIGNEVQQYCLEFDLSFRK